MYDEYTNSKGKGVSANDEYQLLEYLKSGDYTRGVTEEERRILVANYNAYVLGNVAEYKSLNALADQMVEEFNNQDNTFVTCDGAEIKRLPNGDYVVTYTMSKCDLYDEDYNEITHISMYFSAEDIECGIYVKKEAFMREVSSIYADCVDKDLISLEVKLQREKDLETMKGMINEYILSEEDKQKALEIVEQNYYENYILTEVFGKDKKRAADISKENWEKAKNATLVAVAVASLVFPPSWFVSTGALIISLSATTADYIHTNFIQGEDYANIEKNSVAYAIEAAGELLGYGFEMYNLKVDKALKPTKEMLSKADDLKWTPERIEKTMQNIDSLDDVFVKYSDDVITKTDDVVKADDAGRVVNKLDDVAEIANEVDDVYQTSYGKSSANFTEGGTGSRIQIVESIPPNSEHPVNVYTDGKAQINTGKVDIYIRGKVELNVNETNSRIKELELIKKNNPESFTKAMNSELKKCKDQLHNYQRSQEMSKTLLNAGIEDSLENNQIIVENLLTASKNVSLSNTEVISYLEGPKGRIQIVSRWKVLEDGTPYLATVILKPVK